MADQVTPPADPVEPQSDPAPKASAPEKYPDDHPLVTALAAQKQKNAELQKQIDDAKTKPPVLSPEQTRDFEQHAKDSATTKDGDLAAQLADLQAKFEQAEADKTEAQTVALRTRMAAGKIPAALITKLTGTTEDEIAAEIAEIAPFLKSGPVPNPQQGHPSEGRGGSIAAGRDRYQQSHATP